MNNIDLKERATTFLLWIVEGKIEQAYAQFTDENMLHHNPYFKGDRTFLINGMLENEHIFPNKIYEVKHIYQDGQTVIVHAHLRFKATDAGMIVVHICRFKQNKIIEFWDIGQQIPDQMLNENGMF